MTREPVAVLPPRSSALGFNSLLINAGALVAAMTKRQSMDASALPRGDGAIVLVIPAFLAGDAMTAGLRHFLRYLGYRPETAGVRMNVGATPRLIAKLEAALIRLSNEQGGPIFVVGQSLGGVLARDLALRYPQHVRRVVTLCSPIRVPITTPLAFGLPLIAPLFDRDWLARRNAICGPLSVPVTALYSEDDGVVDWRECLQDNHPASENIRVEGAHSTIGASPSALAAIARALRI
jgi:pimeloyl-ACP methyl ester carboxylesterase